MNKRIQVEFQTSDDGTQATIKLVGQYRLTQTDLVDCFNHLLEEIESDSDEYLEADAEDDYDGAS